jgi:hypothetical protein
MNCIIYTVSCNFAIHVTCPLKFIACKYSELQGQLQNTHFSHSVSTLEHKKRLKDILMHLYQ